MSALSGTGSALNGSNSALSTASNGLSSITQSEFLQLLLTQLQNQNPLDPMTDSDFAQQLATLSEVGSIDTLSTNLTSLLQAQQLYGASSLIGRTVTYLPSGASGPSQGVVSGLSVQKGTVDLTVNNTDVPLSQVSSIN